MPLGLELHEHGEVTVLEMRHAKANTLDTEFLTSLIATLDGLRVSDARAIVLTGRGRIFSGGVDLVRAAEGGAAYLKPFLPLVSQVFETLFHLPKPVVAAVNGHAIAGGCVLAACCDHRVMTDADVGIGVPELHVGVPFPTVALEVMRFVAPSRVSDLVCGGRILSPGEALGIGLVDALVPPEALIATALDRARRLASIATETFAFTKRQLRAPTLARCAARTEDDAEIVRQWCSEAALATMRAYIERTLGRAGRGASRH